MTDYYYDYLNLLFNCLFCWTLSQYTVKIQTKQNNGQQLRLGNEQFSIQIIHHSVVVTIKQNVVLFFSCVKKDLFLKICVYLAATPVYMVKH